MRNYFVLVLRIIRFRALIDATGQIRVLIIPFGFEIFELFFDSGSFG